MLPEVFMASLTEIKIQHSIKMEVEEHTYAVKLYVNGKVGASTTA